MIYIGNIVLSFDFFNKKMVYGKRNYPLPLNYGLLLF
jgi:hypothetical protein